MVERFNSDDVVVRNNLIVTFSFIKDIIDVNDEIRIANEEEYFRYKKLNK